MKQQTGGLSSKKTTYPSKKNTLEAYWEQEEKEVQKLKSSQSNKRFSMWKLSLTLQREQKGIDKKCVSIAKKRELSSWLCTDWRDAKSLNNWYVSQIYTIIVFSFQCRSASWWNMDMHVVLKLLASTKNKVLSTENTPCYFLSSRHIREPENMSPTIIFILLRNWNIRVNTQHGILVNPS